jgi:hypothetical protein
VDDVSSFVLLLLPPNLYITSHMELEMAAIFYLKPNLSRVKSQQKGEVTKPQDCTQPQP